MIDTGTEQLLCDIDEGIALVTFNNPTKHNALSAPIREALPGVLRALQADDAVRVVVLTGAGEKAFVSGADISEFGTQRTTPEARADFDAGQVDAARAWVELEKPIIAMIRGYCIGGGLLTALQADIRICSRGQPVRRARRPARTRLRLRRRRPAHAARRPVVGQRDPVLGAASHRRRGAARRTRQPGRAHREPAG